MKELLTLILVVVITTSGRSESPKGRFDHTSRSFGQRPSGFVLTGVFTGFADSTLLYLEVTSDANTVYSDSAYIINNRFHLKGQDLYGEALHKKLEEVLK